MFYIALCDDEWQAVEILTGYLSEIKRRDYSWKVCLF